MPIRHKSIRMFATAFGAIILMMMNNSHAADEACQLKSLGSIELVMGKVVLVPVSINSKPAYLVLRTSSAFTVISEPAIEAFGLKRRKFYSRTTIVYGHQVLKELAEVGALQLGDLKFAASEMLVHPENDALTLHNDIPIIGWLGMESFSTVDFELDLARGKLNLFSQDHCPGKVVYWTNEYGVSPLLKESIGSIYFPIELDGEKLEAVFDSWNTGSSIDTDITKKVYGFDENSAGNEKTTGTDGKESYFYRAMEITAPGLAIADTRIQLRGPSKGCGSSTKTKESKAAGYDKCMGVFPLNLGRGVMETLRIYFATKENMVYYSSASATK